MDDMHNILNTKPRRRRKTPKKDSESAVLRECLAWLHEQEDVLYVERRNTGALATTDGGYIKFGHKGAADIWCLVNTGMNDPIHVEIECKARKGGRLSDAQKAFQARCKEIEIEYLVVRSAEELEKKLWECVGMTD